MEEEMALLEEQLASAHADIESLQERLADAVAKAETHQSQVAALRQQLQESGRALADREEALSARNSELEALQTAAVEAQATARLAAGRYRDLLLAAEPELPAELIAGDSIDAVDDSAARARQTVAQVRQHLEQQAQAHRVPAGAPPRSAPDLSGLSPAEKIRLGLEERG